jgi:hypothetical protein
MFPPEHGYHLLQVKMAQGIGADIRFFAPKMEA